MSTAKARSLLNLRHDPARGKIFSHIRQDWFVEFPEELVRQQFVCTLVNDYGYSLDQMDEESKVQRGRQSAEADVVIWRTAKDKAEKKAPLIVVECKSDNAAINAKDYGQGESYARIVDIRIVFDPREAR
jgi:type I restriction enzyme M protein